MNHARRAWSAITASQTWVAVTVATVICAVVVGGGISLAVGGARQSGLVAEASPSRDQDTATPTPSPSPMPTLSPSETPRTTPSPSAPTAIPTPTTTPQVAATQQPVTRVDAVCDDLEIDADDNIFVDGELAEQTEYQQRQAMSVLILAARATRSPSASVCLDVEVPEMVVTGTVHLCGAASSTILEPAPTPSESEPDATWAPRYGEPMIDGVAIPERLNDWNSYRLLEIADVLDVPVCLDLSAQDNVIRFTISLAVCVSVETDSDDRMTIVIDEREWHFYPEQVLDADGLLAADKMVEASLKIENYRDDSDAYLAMTVWVSPPCSLTGP